MHRYFNFKQLAQSTERQHPRAVFTCPRCNGEGTLDNSDTIELCPSCQGTGEI